MVENLPCNAGDSGSIPGQGTKISDASEQQVHTPQLRRPWATTEGPTCHSRDPTQTNT